MLETVPHPLADGAAWPDPSALLPHGDAARCVDRILAFIPGEQLRVGWRVTSASLLFDPARGGVPSWAGIEVMAQCAGLYLGLMQYDERTPRTPPVGGYLLGVRSFRAHASLLGAGALLIIEAACAAIHDAGERGSSGLFDCRILCNDALQCDACLLLWSAGHETGTRA